MIGLVASGAAVSPAMAANAMNDARSTCLTALEKSDIVNRARHAPGSTADLTEVVSTNSANGEITVRWKTSVLYSGGAMKPILWGICHVTKDGKKVKSINYGK